MDAVPYVVAFTLPLGFLGSISVLLLPVYVIARRDRLPVSVARNIWVAVPLTTAVLLSVAGNADPSARLLPASGFALILTVGFASTLAIATHVSGRRLLIAYLAGTCLLALSVVIDAGIGATRLPSGLFLYPELHNWTASLLAIGFPISLHFATTRGQAKLFGAVGSGLLLLAAVLTLSWVGLLGIGVGTVAVIKDRWARALVGVPILLATIIMVSGVGVQWKLGLDDLRVRGHSLSELRYVLAGRLEVFRQAIDLAKERPLLGWGWATSFPTISEVPGVASVVEAGLAANGANLVASSEALDALPWRGVNAFGVANRDRAPNGEKSADLLIGHGVDGHRVYQLLYVGTHRTDSYTFSLWSRTNSGTKSIGLSIGDRDGNPVIVDSVRTSPNGSVVNGRVARFTTQEEWQRHWISVQLHDEPTDGLLVVSIYLDGYFLDATRNDQLLTWGAQLVPGTDPMPYVENASRGATADVWRLAHFHSWPMQTLFESGLPGVLTLVWMFALLLSRSRAVDGFPMRAVVLVFACTQMLDYSAHQSSVLLSFLLLVSMGLVARQQAQLNRGEHARSESAPQ